MKGFLSIISLLFISSYSLSAWYPVNTGISDDFTSISYKNQTTGLITGKKGVYLSTTGGITAGSWARIQNCATPADSIIYNHSQFYSSAETNEYSSLFIYFCGRDTISSTGVIFRYSIASNAIELVYSGGTRFNKIANNESILMYAVGDNGKLVYFNESNPVVQTISTGFSFNLTSIDATVTSLKIGSNDYLVHGTVASPGNITFTSSYYPGRNLRDVVFMNGTSTFGYAVGKNMIWFQNPSISEPHKYYADSLMANSVTQGGGLFFIGTNNGIYKTTYYDILEFQPSSIGKRIQGICSIVPNFLIACGDNGVILYTNVSGGTPEPYAQIDFDGACLNISQPINTTKGTVTNCANYVDNVLINSNCNNYYNYTFTTPGTHQIKLVVSNAFYSKTIIKDVEVVSPPLSLSTAVADDTLCKSEALDITIFGSQPGIYYSLYKSGSSVSLGTSEVGDGTDLDFHTNLLNETGTYYIKAAGTIANCVTTFSTPISIVVEHPEAKFHKDLINAEVNETVRFYEQCSEAVNFEWQFTGTPSIAGSTLPDVTNSFATLGSSPVTLIAGTANGCYDTLTVNGPFIYQPYTDSSWLIVNTKIQGTADPYVIGEDIKKTIKSRSSGYLVAGDYLNRVLHSRVGDSMSLPGYGGYLAKYDDLGILKWCINTDPLPDASYPRKFVSDITEDGNGNIYVIGKTPSNGIIDNRGDTLCGNQNFILKLDSLGNTIWNRTTNFSHGDQMAINRDYDNSIYVTSLFFQNPNGQAFPFMLNGITEDTIRFTESICQLCNHQYKIFKITETGQLEYDFLVEISATNSYVVPQVVFDSSNNIYVWGSKELIGTIHAPITGDIVPVDAAPSSYGGNMYISKFDINGNHLWKVEGYTENSPNDVTEAITLKADAAGNLYLTGRNNFDGPSHPQIMINADNSLTSFYGGQYFIAKINSNGITQWINGNDKSDFGIGFDLLLDGDTIYTVAEARNYNNQNIPLEIIGTNTSVSMLTSPNNYFIAKYLTDGTILKTYLNGPSDLISGLYADNYNFPDLIQLNDGYFLLNKTIETSIYAPDTAIDFGYPLPPTGQPDGNQLKIKLEQGIEFLPHFYTEFNYYVCYGSSFTYPDGMIIPSVLSYTSRIDSLVSVNGTDSIIKYQVMVYPNQYTFNNLVVCRGSDVLLGDGTTLTNIQDDISVTLTLQSIHGCDSISTVNIYVQTVSTSISGVGNHLSVPNVSDSYQWIDCSLDFIPIPNQQDYAFTPIEDGSYAVIVSINGCVDTSDCYLLDELSLNESVSSLISISPNPTPNKTTVDFGQAVDLVTLVVYSSDGRKIVETTLKNVENYVIDLTNFERGTYFAKISSANLSDSEFIIVKI